MGKVRKNILTIMGYQRQLNQSEVRKRKRGRN
jgi:hypothetical protein